MKRIRVVINGALGKMGREVIKAVLDKPDLGLDIVGAVEEKVAQQYLPLLKTSELIPFSSDLHSLLTNCHPDVVVDFTNAAASMAAVHVAAKLKINMVIGTTGLSEENIREIDQLCQDNNLGVIVAPNFSLGTVLLMHLAKIAARFFDRAEIMEMHHAKKIDAPSGTAIATAKAMLQARGKPFIYPKTEKEIISHARGGEVGGIAIHSLRLPGFMAGQKVIFSGPGETLSLHSDAISRESYMPGVILAIKEITKRKGFIYGLDTLLEL
ncbi:MAG: 4-hydroxy-tetrahydrodipicolinate reductase [Dehalococcoidia bacterium]|nr:4-hydroxy-tetrahydrodipicolinate reductase [Dehalococcoidia bacterium]